MIYGSVASGIEAATVAWESLGWTPAWFSEIEPFPSAVLAHHYPAVPNRGDMTKFKEWPDGRIDALVGGTPCQSFSVAGLRRGLDDPRGSLMLVYLAIARRYHPTWIVWENVPGVLSSNGGRDFGTFLGGLAELGYGFAYAVLDAQFFGVPQRRRRVFVVGYLGDWRPAAAVLFESQSLRGDSPPSREAGTGVAARTARSVAIRGRDGTPQAELGDEVANAILTPNGGRGGIGVGAVLERYVPDVSPAMKARDAKGPSSDGDGDGDGLPLLALPRESIAFTQNQRDEVRTLKVAGALGSIRRGDAKNETVIAHTLRGEGFNAGEDGTGRGTPIVASTLKSNSGGGGFGSDPSETFIPTTMAVRRLTPRECERLQGFPDDYTAITYRNKPAADGPRYRALGNSMAVPVMRWLGERIDRVQGLVI